MNQLPPSTLTTTPHLLHTRTTLTLPPGLRRPPSPPPADAADRLARRAQEQAAKRLQFVTKELDPHIARTYVSLASGEFDAGSSKEGKSSHNATKLEDRAVNQYMEDSQWEAEERRGGREPRLQPFPFFSSKAVAGCSSRGEKWSSGSWW